MGRGEKGRVGDGGDDDEEGVRGVRLLCASYLSCSLFSLSLCLSLSLSLSVCLSISLSPSLSSPQNIKLIDFGLIAHPPAIAATRLTTCCGSAAYAAPELIRGEPYLGPPVRGGVWGMG